MKVVEQPKPKLMVCTGRGNGERGCGAVLEVELSDLRYWPGVSSSSGWGDSDPAVIFKCPVCHTATDIPEDLWPNTSFLRKASSSWIHGTKAEDLT